MGKFSISDLENLSGIKAHTIRMWEQRYGILRPVRTSTNIRTYCESDLRRLLNVATLCNRGHRISRVAQLSEQELCQAVMQCGEEGQDHVPQVNALLAAAVAMDEPQLQLQITAALDHLGFEEAMLHILYPFLRRVGIMWQVGTINPAQEHLVANLIRQKMVAAIDALPYVPPTEARRWVLFLPQGELHELGLLFMSYALRARQHHVLYLGQNLPVKELAAVCEAYQPYALCTVLTSVPERDQVQGFIEELARISPHTPLFLYGPLVQRECLQLPGNAVQLRLMTDFLALANSLTLHPEPTEVLS
ncbi:MULTISPECIES: MerR family transcriptional regulator [Hymenobacter]|uniref:MerR family transcriptional regulator n=2 Tax=Hymenobacter TaxID=89966 RepID=A0ABS6WUK6_9BACT|nr:MerR family transcriptional regulator [Hymenobacter defluvii]MBW3127257.1 MerR family transcriptional regulator [Hymenobacter profundi]